MPNPLVYELRVDFVLTEREIGAGHLATRYEQKRTLIISNLILKVLYSNID